MKALDNFSQFNVILFHWILFSLFLLIEKPRYNCFQDFLEVEGSFLLPRIRAKRHLLLINPEIRF